MMPTRPVLVLSAVALTTVLAACSNSESTSARRTGPAGSGDAHVASVTITAANGCTPDKVTFPAGGITFKVSNKDATAVSEVELLAGERIVGEKENLPPGFAGQFAVSVAAGSYTLYCPGAAKPRVTVRAHGSAKVAANTSVTALLDTASKQYATYVDTQIAGLLTSVKQFASKLHGTDLAAARTAYIAARPYYERIEPVAESFVIGRDSIDADIDAREGDVPTNQWGGFHRIEKLLFAQNTLTGTAAYGDKLVANVVRLQKLTKGLSYKPTELANGAQGLLDEVAKTKITGEEERYSHIDLLDFANNDEAAEQAFAQLQPALAKIDPVLSKTVSSAFAALDQLVGKYRTTANPSGYKLYTQLTSADKRGLAAAVKAVQEPLSTVASKVANA
jgi:iron uptake system component EfeO